MQAWRIPQLLPDAATLSRDELIERWVGAGLGWARHARTLSMERHCCCRRARRHAATLPHGLLPSVGYGKQCNCATRLPTPGSLWSWYQLSSLTSIASMQAIHYEAAMALV